MIQLYNIMNDPGLRKKSRQELINILLQESKQPWFDSEIRLLPDDDLRIMIDIQRRPRLYPPAYIDVYTNQNGATYVAHGNVVMTVTHEELIKIYGIKNST